MNIDLPDPFFITFYRSHDIRINFGAPIAGQTGRLFLPFDALMGVRLTDKVQLSLEGSVPIVKEYPVYNFKTETRLRIVFRGGRPNRTFTKGQAGAIGTIRRLLRFRSGNICLKDGLHAGYQRASVPKEQAMHDPDSGDPLRPPPRRPIFQSLLSGVVASLLFAASAGLVGPAQAQQKRPNIVMLMTDDTGWNDFGAYSGGGAGLGHPTPNVDRIAKEGAVFTNWYGQASCTAGRASFITGRIPIRSALSIVVAPGDENRLRKETPTIAEFFQKNGYTTYFSGKWHLGDKPDAYPTEHGFDEMKHFAAYYAGVYSYNDTSKWFHPWFPSYNPEYNKMYDDIVNLGEWEGVAGKPAKMVGTISYDTLATFDIRQTDSAVGLHQTAREEQQAVLHGRQLHQDAQPDQRGAGVQRQVASRRLFGFPYGNGRRYRPDHGRHPCRGARHDCHPDGRQRRLAGCLSRRRDHAVPRREGIAVRRRLARSGDHVVAEQDPGWRSVLRNDVAHRCLGDACRDGRSQAPAT